MSRYNQFNKTKGGITIYTIYKYTNSVNGKVYIGQTSTTLEERAQSNGHNYISSPKFYSAIKSYGWKNFMPSILAIVNTIEEANDLEMFYISKYKSNENEFGYNISIGGQTGVIDEESKKLISDKAKERYKDKTKNPMYGKTHSEETKRKMRESRLGENNPMFGTKWTETQRRCCGTKGKTLNLSNEQRENLRIRATKLGKETGLRPVKCIEDGTVFNSVTEAAITYGVSKSTLNGHLKGRQLSCAGKHFEYLN